MPPQRSTGAISTSTRRARSTQSVRPGDADPRAVVRALKRELSRLQAVDSKLTAAQLSLDGLRRERAQEKKRTDQAQASLSTLTETLEAIQAIRHGKRVDRRLAKAQKLAERGLRRAQGKKGPAISRS
jgi:chromosome segregation ATPase